MISLGYLGIDNERITKINYSIPQNDEQLTKRSISNQKIDSSPDEFIRDALARNESTVINFYFTITDRNETSNDTSTGLHVVTLLLLISDLHSVLDLCEMYSMKVETLSMVSDKNKTRDEFCSEPDVMYPTKNGILRRRIRPDGEIDYVVDIPELETTYEGGDYTYVFIVSTFTQQPSPKNETVIQQLLNFLHYSFCFHLVSIGLNISSNESNFSDEISFGMQSSTSNRRSLSGQCRHAYCSL